MKAGFRRIFVAGLGLIGGSFAGGLRDLTRPPEIVGADMDEAAVREALRLGIVDRGFVVSADEWLAGREIFLNDVDTRACGAGDGDRAGASDFDAGRGGDGLSEVFWDGMDLVMLVIPVAGYPAWFRFFEEVSYTGVITDAGSTKEAAIGFAEAWLARPSRFVPGHPMAGSETGGLAGARKDLFCGAYWILTPGSRTDVHMYRRLHRLLTALGARVISVDPAEHDRVTAIVSHVPHIAAAALVMLAGNHIGEKGDLLRLAAGGFRDTTRVAAGNPALWQGILLDNSVVIAEELDEYIRIIRQLRDSIAAGDEQQILSILDTAAEIRRNIPAKWVPDSARLTRVRIPMGNRPGIIADITAAAGRTGCNIQAIDIDHQTEARAVLELALTDEGDREAFSAALASAGFSAWFSDEE